MKYTLLFYLYILIILLFISFINQYLVNRKEKYHFRNMLIKNNKHTKNRIIYLINPTAGLANTLRGMSSTIFLSFFYSSSFFLKGWNSIRFYFDFPIEFLYNGNINNITSYKRFNINMLNMNKSYIKLVITDIHGYMKILIKRFNYSKNMRLIKVLYSLININEIKLNNIIYDEIFIPSDIINDYISLFNIKKRNKRVLGIHIRSGIFNNNYTEHCFSKIYLKHYYSKSKEIIFHFNISYIYVATDNLYYSNEIKKIFWDKLINITFVGDVIHSRFALYDKMKSNNAVRIVSEFILLSNCDIILGTKMSSFSYESCNRIEKYCFFI